MLALPISIILIILAFYFKKHIRKNSTTLYILFTILAVLAFVIQTFPLFTPIQKGAIGLSFFYVVMLTGAFKEKSKLRISLLSVRKEYSILGFILISPHAIHYFIEFVLGNIAIPIYAIIAYIIMIPLFITSFTPIRKKFTYPVWKNLQRFAYASYLLLFIHLMIHSDGPNKIVYIILFSVYALLKVVHTYRYLQIKSSK